jgi:fluoroacetyl-CoA thioesterase
MRPDLKPGLKYTKTVVVGDRMTAHAISEHFGGNDAMPKVFATAFMVVFTELTCAEAVLPYLDSNEGSVGTHVDMSHLAATPVGMTVTADVELIEVTGRKLRFKVSCRDEKDVIGEGFHDRGVIDQEKFRARIAAKSA